jgi:hypothetical protein
MSRLKWAGRRLWGLLVMVLAGAWIWHLPLVRVAELHEDVVGPATCWLTVAFICVYTILAPWWRSPMGRLVVSLDVALAAVLAHDVAAAEFGVTFSAVTLQRVQTTALIAAAVTVLSRMWLLGRLHGFKVRWPWGHLVPWPPPWVSRRAGTSDNPAARTRQEAERAHGDGESFSA